MSELLLRDNLERGSYIQRDQSGSIKPIASTFVLLALTILLGACGSSGGSTVVDANESAKKNQEPQVAKTIQSKWNESVDSSGIDGKTVTRTKVFKTAQDASRVIVKLTCLVDAKRLTMRVESYGADGSTPSEFVTERRVGIFGVSGPVPVGRLKLASADPVNLSSSFANDKYSNVIAWDLSKEAKHFIATEYSNRRVAAQSAFAKTHPAGSSYANDMAMDAWYKETNGLQPGQLGQAESAYGSGNYLKSVLPVFIEASNQQGTFEIQIPTDDPGVNDLIHYCAKAGLTAAQFDSIFTFGEDKSATASGPPANETPVGPTSAATSPVQSNTIPDTVAQGSIPSSTPTSLAPTAEANQPSVLPSFDCSKASTAVEKLICATPDLSAADNEMSAAYKRACAAAGSNAGLLKRGQRDFIAKRNQCETSVCISEAYRSRLAMLALSAS